MSGAGGGLGEFELIGRYFAGHDQGGQVALGVGDDCALLRCPAGWELALTTDTLSEGVHFFPATAPRRLGYKALAVNLSDLAAMGARPEAFLLALTLPQADPAFLGEFSAGLLECAAQAHMALIGGNTTRGPLSITITACGCVRPGRALQRSLARPGDTLFVTGTLGLPGLYVEAGYGRIDLEAEVVERLEEQACRRPLRAAFAHEAAQRGLCRCAIDISDGFIGDLGHILESSALAACVQLECLPCDEALGQAGLTRQQQLELACFGGCDYELVMSVGPGECAAFTQLARSHGVRVTAVGQCRSGGGGERLELRCDGQPAALPRRPFEHFP